MASPQSPAYKHWLRILRRWPIDLVRPDSISFRTVMQRRLDRLSSKPSSNDLAARSIESNDALVTPVKPSSSSSTSAWTETHELSQTNSLYSLLENRYAKTYPLPSHLRRPASNPSYYDDLLKELEEAPNRSWLGKVVKRVGGLLRFS